MSGSLKIKIDDQQSDVDAEAFLNIFSSTLRTLKAISKKVATVGKEKIRWRISEATKSSPLSATLVGEPEIPNRPHDTEMVMDAFVGGLKHLEAADTCPPMFDEQTLGFVRQFAQSKARGISYVEFSANGMTATATKEVAHNAVNAIRRLQQKSGQYRDYGSVEGKLATLNSRQGKQFVVDDVLTGESITCYFSSAEVESVARKAWDHRVCAVGELRIDKQTGNPTSVKVDEIQILRDQKDIPQLDDIEGIDITGGMESSDYVRKLRDDAYG